MTFPGFFMHLGWNSKY